MIERILKHMNIYKEMKNAAIPLKLIGKKGEDFCMKHGRLFLQTMKRRWVWIMDGIMKRLRF